MNNNKKHYIFLLNIILIFFLLISLTYGWMVDYKASRISTTSSIIRTYFESGNGSEEYPFEIARPIQLYYFSWLQQLGFFNMEDPDYPGTVKQYHFYVSTDLDMSEYSIPSIGTISQPFVGKFDGRGHIISNLTVDNSPTLTDIPEGGTLGDQIVGFFGVVGSYGIYPIYSYNKVKNVVTNFALHNVTVMTQAPNQNKSLIGIVAGYVNGFVTDVAVSNSSIHVASGLTNLDSSNLSNGFSEYTLIGYCEEAYKSSLYVTEVLYSEPNVSTMITYTDEGAKNEWGGSVAMKAMYERLVRIFSAAQSDYSYIPSKIEYFDENGNLLDSSAASPIPIDRVKYYANADIGRFSMYSSVTKLTGTEDAYTYSLGKTTNYTKLIRTSVNPDGVIISDGSNYISLTGTTVSNETSLLSATILTYNGTNGTISVNVNGTNRYLNQNGTTLTTLTTGTSSSSATVWKYDANNRLYCVKNNQTYYLQYIDGWKLRPLSGYKISSGSNYLSIATDGTITNVTNSNSATVWHFTGSLNGKIFAVANNRMYYLTISSSNLSLTQTATSATDFSNSNNRLYYGSNYICYRRFLWTWTWTWTTSDSSNATTLTFTSSQVTLQSISVSPIKKEIIQVPDYYTTYFPLSIINPNVSSTSVVNAANFGVATNNTGYVISGSQYLYNSDNTYRDSDIRVSRYGMDDLEKSLGGTSYSAAKLEILTRTKTSGGIVRITDKYNSNHTNTNLNQYSAKDVFELGLLKYNNSRDSIHNLFNGQKNVYGLHFMDATISKERLLTVEKAVINHNTYKNYQMPMDSIDFQLSSNGYINFYAGTYFPDNNTFFSLHQIFRYRDQLSEEAVLQAYESAGNPIVFKLNDGNFYIYENGEYTSIKLASNFDTTYQQKFEYVYMKSGDPNAPVYYKTSNNIYYTYSNGTFTQQSSLPSGYVDVNIITDIKEIVEIYGVYTQDGFLNVNYDFIYKFSDNSFSGTLTSEYEMAFDLNWIKYPSIEMYSVYYFELPANRGEYALGSVPGRVGAYLMYLDLSSNAQEIHRTTITDYVTQNIYTYEYPKGVQIVSEGSSYSDDIDSITIKLPLTFVGGTMTITRVGDVVTYSFTGGNKEVIFNYIGDDLTLQDSGGNKAVREPLSVFTITTRTVTQVDYNIITRRTTVKQTITLVDHLGQRISIVVITYTLDVNGDLVGEVETDYNGEDDNKPIFAVTFADASFVAHMVAPSTSREVSLKADYRFTNDLTDGTIIADDDGVRLYSDITISVTDNESGTTVVKIDKKAPKFKLYNENGTYTRYDMEMSINGVNVNQIGSSINVNIDTTS